MRLISPRNLKNTFRASEQSMFAKLSFLFVLLCMSTVAWSGQEYCANQRSVFSGLNGIDQPSAEDIMRLGQLGGNLCPTVSDSSIASRSAFSKNEVAQHKAFGEAMEHWNQHDYAQAYQLLDSYLTQYPDGLWAGEAQLHMGCDARFNGRYTEANKHFTHIIEKYAKQQDAGAVRIVDKAKSRLAVLRFMENNPSEAKQLFNELSEQSKDWRLRTYAQHWLKRIHSDEHAGQALADCGYRALENVLAQSGKTLKGHRQSTHTLGVGQSLKELKELAQKNGLSVTPVKASMDDLPNLKTPFIAQIDRSYSGGAGHYWVVESVNAKQVKLYDAQSQRRFMQKPSEFAKEWQGYALVFDNNDALNQIALNDAQAVEVMGGCCGVQRPEDDLGDDSNDSSDSNDSDDSNGSDSCNSDKGCPQWKINMKNMNIFMSDTPLWYATPYGPDVNMRLSYNSQSALAQNETFGAKWMFSYGGYVVEDPGQSAIVFMPDGARIPFTSDGNGGFESRADIVYKLEKKGAQHYELKFKNGDVFVYTLPEGTRSQQVFLTQIKDIKGHALTMHYNAKVQLVRITDAQGRDSTLSYNDDGFVTKITDPFGRMAVFTYTDAPVSKRSLASITDMGGFKSDIQYDENLYPKKLIKPYGTWGFKVEPSSASGPMNGYPPFGASMWANYRITVTDPEGDKSEYHYNGYSGYSWYVSPENYQSYPGNNKTPKKTYRYARPRVNKTDTVTLEDGTKKRYTYGAYGRITSKIDENGKKVEYTYNSAKQKTQFKVNGKVLKTYEYVSPNYHYLSKLVEYIDENNPKITAYQYDDKFNLLKKETWVTGKENEKSIIRYTYNEQGQVTSVDGARTDVNDVTRFTYHPCNVGVQNNNCGQLHQLINAKGQVIAYSDYDASGQPRQVLDEKGLTTHYEYDLMGRTISVEHVSGNIRRRTTFKYAGVIHKLAQVNLPNGEQIKYSYDTDKRLTNISDTHGDFIRYTRDKNGNVIEKTVNDVSGTLHQSVTYEFNARNQLIKRTDATQQSNTFTYYGNGQLKTQTNPLNVVKQFTLNKDNQIERMTAPDQGTTQFEYTNWGLLSSVTDANGVKTVYGYDGLGRLMNETSPDKGQTQYTYDIVGNLVTLEMANQYTSTYQYDELNRLVSVQHNKDGKTQTQQNRWDADKAGELSAIRFEDGYTEYKRNTFGDLVQEKQRIGAREYITRFDYDDYGQLSRIHYPTEGNGIAPVIEYVYEKGRVKQLNWVNGNTSQVLVSDINYHPMSGIRSYALGNGIRYEQALNLNAQLISQNYDAERVTYQYSPVGDIESINHSGKQMGFSYDDASRLESITLANQTTRFAYDNVGNRTQKQHDANPLAYRYKPKTNQLSVVGAQVYERDAIGNLTKDADNSYVYGANNRLSEVRLSTQVKGAPVQLNMQYRYHPLGYRISKKGTSEYSKNILDKLNQLDARLKQKNAEQTKKQALKNQQETEISQLETSIPRYESLLNTMEQFYAEHYPQMQKQIKDLKPEIEKTKQKVEQEREVRRKAEQAFQKASNTYQQTPQGWNKFLAFNKMVRARTKLTNAEIALGLSAFHLSNLQRSLSQVVQAKNTLVTNLTQSREKVAKSKQRKQSLTESVAKLNQNLSVLKHQVKDANAQIKVLEQQVKTIKNITTNTVYANGGYWPLSQFKMQGDEQTVQHYIYLYDRPIALLQKNKQQSQYQVYYYQTNQINAPLKLTDKQKNTVWQAQQIGFKLNVIQSDIEQPLRFPGQLEDKGTGFYYNYYRYYNPSTGRYITSDPIGLDGGVDRFGYVNQNPLYNIDPNGNLGIYVVVADALGSLAQQMIVSSVVRTSVILAGRPRTQTILRYDPILIEVIENGYLNRRGVCINVDLSTYTGPQYVPLRK